jgi:hypothetical protein
MVPITSKWRLYFWRICERWPNIEEENKKTHRTSRQAKAINSELTKGLLLIREDLDTPRKNILILRILKMNKTRIPRFVHENTPAGRRKVGRRRKPTPMKTKQACKDIYPFAAAADDDDDE